MAASNHISNVAIVGAGGNVGRFMTEALLKTGKHTVTAITRADSQTKLPDGVVVKQVDYSKPETVVAALEGNDALIVTLSGHALDLEKVLIDAAGEAGVAWILPNGWSPDNSNEDLVRDVFVFKHAGESRKRIEEVGKSSYISVMTGFWYEYSLAIPPAFGFDIPKREVTFFDEGDTRMSVSTWPQTGRAIAALLGLPIKPENGNEEACLETYRNKCVFVTSFTINQKNMFASLLRTTGTKKSDWTIRKEPIKERYATAMEKIKTGHRPSFAAMMYGRVFYPDGSGDFEHGKGTLNKVLGLPKEDIDGATKIAVERAETVAEEWRS